MSILHSSPSLKQLKKQSKELLSAHQSGNHECCRILKQLKKFSEVSDKQILESKVALHDVQYAMAIDYGFKSWGKLKKFVLQSKLHSGGPHDEIAEVLKAIPSGENVLSVDIGDRTLKVAELSNPVIGKYTLFSFAVQKYDLHVPEQSMFKTISDTLRKKKEEIGFKGSKCLLSLSPQSVFMGFEMISVKDVEKKDLRSALFSQISKSPHGKINDPVIGLHLISTSKEGSHMIMTATVEKSYLNQLIKAVRKAGLDPVLILPSPVATYNSAVLNGVGEKSCELVLNLGASSTTMVFCESGNYFIKAMPMGSDELTKRIADKFDIPFADAEKLKREKGFIGNPETMEISRIAFGFMDEMCRELKRSMNAYKAQENRNYPVRISLAGGGSVMPGTISSLFERMKTPVEYLNPFKVIHLDDSVNRRELAETAHLFSELIGLNLCLVGDIAKSINLRSDD